MVCPSCQNENTQTIKMVLLSGSSTSKAKAVGIDSRGDVGVAGISSNSMTNLAASLDPGAEPGNNAGFGYLGCGGLLLVSGLLAIPGPGGAGGGLLFASIGGVLLFVGFAKKEDGKSEAANKVAAWKAKRALAENGWICHRCGHTWLPRRTVTNQ